MTREPQGGCNPPHGHGVAKPAAPRAPQQTSACRSIGITPSRKETPMKGAQAYINDQWRSCGLAQLPQEREAMRVQLHFIVPRDAQFTSLFNEMSAVCEEHL